MKIHNLTVFKIIDYVSNMETNLSCTLDDKLKALDMIIGFAKHEKYPSADLRFLKSRRDALIQDHQTDLQNAFAPNIYPGKGVIA